MNFINGFRLLRFLLLAAIFLFPLSSCTTIPERRVKSDYTVAVLPLYNATADVDGPALVRRVFDKKLQRYYKTKPLNEVDELLRDQMGITLGGQLEMTTPQKLGEVLGVNGVIYGYLLDFDDVATAAYNVRKVRAGFKLVDTRTGNVVWARGKGIRRVSGIFDAGLLASGDDNLSIKGTENIPGLDDWLSLKGDISSIYLAYLGLYMGRKPADTMASEEVPPSQVLFTFFLGLTPLYSPLGAKFVGNALNIHLLTETNLMVDKITSSIGPEELKEGIISFEPMSLQVPRLFFPAYSVFAERNFSAVMTMTVVNQSSQESVKRKVELAKYGDWFRSSRLSDIDKLSVIVKKDHKKGYLLSPAENKYIEVNLAESDFKETDVIKEFIGEEKIEGQQCNKYKVRVTYGDGWIQDGFIWEAKNLKGLVVKVDLNDKDARIIMELKDVSFATPPASLFEVPEGYTKIDY